MNLFLCLRRALAVILAITCCSFWAGAQSTLSQQYVPGEVIVKFKGESGVVMKANAKGRFATSGKKSLDTTLSELGIETTQQLMPLTGALPPMQKAPSRKLASGRVIEKVDLSKLYCLRFDNGRSVEEMVEMLSALPEVEYAEPNRIVHTCAFETNYSSDPLYSQQWAINAINLPQLWQMPAVDSKRPVIAILDTGVDINHPDLKDNIWTNELEINGAEFSDDDNNGYYDDIHGWDFVNNTAIINNGNDFNGHGTHCAGIAAACGNNGIGIVGANPDAFILPIRVLDAKGYGDVATSIRGVDYAVAAGAEVLSMSYGSYYWPSKAELDAVQNASFCAVCVAAAGNDNASIYDIIGGKPAISSPAAFECVIGVMSSGRDDFRSAFSNFDPDGPFFSNYEEFFNYDITAPGEGIISTYPGGGYKELSGTSMSTPLVAGAISRILQIGGYEKISEYGFLGDIAMSRKEGSEVFDASKAITFDESSRETTIAFSAIEVDDREFGDGDEAFDAGETIDLYPVLRSVWGQVDDNIILSCSIDDNNSVNSVEFISNNVEFGYHLSSRGSAKSKNPIRLRISKDVNDGYNLCLTITAKTADKELYSKQVSYSVKNMVEIGGVIDNTLILYPNTSYLLNRNLIIAENGKLIIKPGVTISVEYEHFLTISGDVLGSISCVGTPDSLIVFKAVGRGLNNPRLDLVNATFKYTEFKEMGLNGSYSSFEHCIFKDCFSSSLPGYYLCTATDCVFINTDIHPTDYKNSYSNFSFEDSMTRRFQFEGVKSSNFINSQVEVTGRGVVRSEYPNYWGSEVESIAHKNIFDINHPTASTGDAKYDLSNMLKRPVAAAHGIVWKVLVDGKDTQDEFDDVLPLGVGKHKFEVYFNRPMNPEYTPVISMGLQKPYSQTLINEDGFWRTEVIDEVTVNKRLWSSSDESVVTVSQDGIIHAVGEGESKIFVNDNSGYPWECSVSVKDSYYFRCPAGSNFSLSSIIFPGNESEDRIWKSDNESAVYVDNKGNVTVLRGCETNVTITVMCGDGYNQSVVVCPVGRSRDEFIKGGNSYHPNFAAISIPLGTSVDLSHNLPKDELYKTPIWSSTDDNIVNVSYDGKIIAKEKGSAVVKARYGQLSEECMIKVVDALPEILMLNKQCEVAAPDETVELYVTYPLGLDDLEWSSSDNNVLTVEKGIVTCHNPGTAIVTASIGNLNAECEITVSNSPESRMLLCLKEIYMLKGESVEIPNRILPEGDFVDVYTAYLTLKGNEAIDGLNRIMVRGARDDYKFEIPTENARFNVMVQAAGSMSSGFMAETGVAYVKLKWDNPEENFDDMLGYNMYRYTMYRDEETGKTIPNKTIKINDCLIDSEEYVDYDVIPGTTYYYYYKVMRTNFDENSPSKVVAATPRAAGKGDANASGNVDVADVVTEVNYMVGRDPKPFIFDAADVNDDSEVDILDVVGTVNIIMAPAGQSYDVAAQSVATYTVEDGVLYVDSPVELAGVQAELSGDRATTTISALQALRGMENTGEWVSDEAYRFLAFSLSGRTLGAGRHALLEIGTATLDELILVDAAGNRIMAIKGTHSGISSVVLQQMKTPTPNPFVDVIDVPVLIGTDGEHAVELSLVDLSGAKVFSHNTTLGFGEHKVRINAVSVQSGFYLLTLTVDGAAVQSHKVIKK